MIAFFVSALFGFLIALAALTNKKSAKIFSPVRVRKNAKPGFGRRNILLIGVLTVCFSPVYSQTTSVANGLWTNNSTWSPASAPSTGSLGVNVVIKNTVNLTGGSLTGWSGTTITINNGGTLQVTGNLDLTGSGINITVNTGGTIDVSGTLSLNNQSQITLQGSGTVKVGDLNLPDNAQSKFNYTSGTLTLTGYLYAGAAEVFSYTSAMSIPGNVTLKNGATITVSNLGGSISITGSSKLTLNTGGALSPASITYGSSSELVLASGTLNYTSSDLTIDSNNKLTINAGIANLKNLTVNSSGTLTVASGATVNVGSTSNVSDLTTGNSSSAIVTNAGTMNVSGNVSSSGVITNSGTMVVTGNLTQANTSNSTTNSGALTVKGNATANGLIQLNPGSSPTASSMIVNGNFTVNANPWLIVGTNVSSCGSAITNYANLVIKQNLILTGSGDVTVNQNGRMAVFGNIDGTSSTGTLVTDNCGGQLYVDGKIDLGTGGGNTVTNNNNASSPTGTNGSPVIGVYVNGTTTAQTISGAEGTKASLKANDIPFYNWIASISGSPLPVTLTFFKIDAIENNVVKLIWATASQENFDKFIVERSTDGVSFYFIGELQGTENSKVLLNYSFSDSNPFIGKNYYRLKSVDLDGKFEYSGVIFANLEVPKELSIYPNPSNGEALSFKTNFEPQEDDVISIIDLSGANIMTLSVTANTGQLNFRSALSPGVYVLKYSSGSFQQVQRLVVK